MAGLDPAIPLRLALCSPDRDGRDKPGHDVVRFVRSLSDVIVRQPMTNRHASSPVFFSRRRVRPYFLRPSTTDRGGRSAAKRNVLVSDAASRQHRSASPCERRHARLAALRNRGDFAPRDRSFRGADRRLSILAGSRSALFTRALARACPTPSSPLIWAAPLSWGGRQTQGVPDTRVRTVARAPHRARACSPARTPVPCLAAPPTAPLQERLMKRPSMSRTEIGL